MATFGLDGTYTLQLDVSDSQLTRFNHDGHGGILSVVARWRIIRIRTVKTVIMDCEMIRKKPEI